MKKAIVLRRISQIFFSAVFVYILWSTTYPLKGVLPAETFFKLNPLIMLITSLSRRVILDGIIFSFVMIVLALILGRFFCGWVCPLGAAIDAVGALRRNKVSLSDAVNEKLRLPKFFILVTIALLSLVGIQVAWVLDPLVIAARFVSLNLIPTVTLVLDKFFIITIQRFELYGWLYDFYRGLKSSFLGVQVYYFSHSDAIFAFFFLIVGSAVFLNRFWCRSICPLGALYALVARFALLRRRVDECKACKRCKSLCRMGAIKDDLTYDRGECILCMDCIYDCPQHIVRFAWPLSKGGETAVKQKDGSEGVTRRNFLFLVLASSVCMFGFRNRKRGRGSIGQGNVIRPPAALEEDEFLDRCIRCGNCMKVCITNGLQPTLFQSGLSGIWTPQLVPEIGYCEYHCTLCGNVCPTGAIPRLTLGQKKKARLGLARINRSTCLPWSQGIECIVCEEHCPIPEKAIKLKKESIGDTIIGKPYIDESLCVGCGTCQNKCPVRPERAIKVYPQRAYRT